MINISYKKKVSIKYEGSNNYTFRITESIKVKNSTPYLNRFQGLISTNFFSFELIPIMNLIVGAFGMNCFEDLSIFYPLGILACVIIMHTVLTLKNR